MARLVRRSLGEGGSAASYGAAVLHAPQVRFMAQRAASYFCVLDTPEACKTQSAS